MVGLPAAFTTLDTGVAGEGHRNIAVEPPALLGRCQGAVVGDGPAVRKAEEVEARDRDARSVSAVVEDLDEDRPHRLRWPRGERHPDVPDGPRPVDVGQRDPFTRSETAAGRALPAAVGGTAPASGSGRVLEGRRPTVEGRVDERRMPDSRHRPPPVLSGRKLNLHPVCQSLTRPFARGQVQGPTPHDRVVSGRSERCRWWPPHSVNPASRELLGRWSVERWGPTSAVV